MSNAPWTKSASRPAGIAFEEDHRVVIAADAGQDRLAEAIGR